MEDPRGLAKDLLRDAGADLWLLWLLYWANGGAAEQWELDAFIHDIPVLEDYDLNLLRWALEDLALRA